MSRIVRLLVGVLFVLLTSGCAQFPIIGSTAHEGSPESFEMMGRVYVRFGAKAFSGSLRWQHEQVRDEVWLGGPLGQTGAHILRDATGAALTTAEQQVYRAMSIESLTKNGLGWSLPLADLSYYVLGKIPGGEMAPATGSSASYERDGWRVRWTPRTGASPDGAPLRLDLAREDVDIRIVIDRLQHPGN